MHLLAALQTRNSAWALAGLPATAVTVVLACRGGDVPDCLCRAARLESEEEALVQQMEQLQQLAAESGVTHLPCFCAEDLPKHPAGGAPSHVKEHLNQFAVSR